MKEKLNEMKEFLKDNDDELIVCGAIVASAVLGFGVGKICGILKGIRETDILYAESYRDLVNMIPYDRWYHH